MKVYVILGTVNYEGDYIDSIHLSRKGAEKALAKIDPNSFDCTEVQEHKVEVIEKGNWPLVGVAVILLAAMTLIAWVVTVW